MKYCSPTVGQAKLSRVVTLLDYIKMAVYKIKLLLTPTKLSLTLLKLIPGACCMKRYY